MKNNYILCCVIFCFLTSISSNQGSKIQDSLSCYYQYKKHHVCAWSESRNATQFVNMNLSLLNGSLVCERMGLVKMTPTHLYWTCEIPDIYPTVLFPIHFTFIPDRDLKSQLNISTKGDEAKPQNIRCKAAHGQISCSWEVRMEITDSVDFRLHYKNEFGIDQEYMPHCHQEIPMYLTCHSNITTGNTTSDMLQNISIRPHRSSQNYTPCLNVKLLPRILIINETNKGEKFIATWRSEQTEDAYFKYHYQFCYWRDSVLKSSEVIPECPEKLKEISPNHDLKVILQTGVHLTRGSNYSVKVRVRLESKPAHYCFKGPWSEWSKVKTLQTNAAQNLLLLYILIPVCVIILIMGALYGCKVLIKYKKQWDDGIPNPNKSSIIEGLQKEKGKKNGSSFRYEDHLYVVPYNKVLMWTPQMSKDSTDYNQDKEQISRPESELIHNDFTQCVFVMYANEEYPTSSVADGYKPFSEMIDEQQSADMEFSQYTVSAFDGPYLFS
ncbi:cytokine receptor common subunit beta-like [Pseudophryne corroboree]|uniref:cytokine receptor common subunit beta-like n=1 Tax=Pseudophryne corroboree TaxID=495146 RepID=UPI00308174E4